MTTRATPASPWTPQQLDAIRTTGCGLLVSAAAGSGKTSVLAQRCAYLVADAPNRCGVDRLLVVTFTEEAAAQMKSRIAAALRERLEQRDDAHLRRQLALLEHAHISTVHSFCLRLIRQHFHRLGLDPAFRVLAEEEGTLLRTRVAEELIDARYEGSQRQAFEAFVDAYARGYDRPLAQQVIATHEMLCSLVDPQRWMQEAIERIEQGAARPLEESALGKAYLDHISAELQNIEGSAIAAANALAGMDGFAKYEAHVRGISAEASRWRRLLDSQGYDAVAQAVRGYERPRLPTIRTDVPGREIAHGLAQPVHDAVKKGPLPDMLSFTSAEWRDGLRAIHPHAQVFIDLVRDFDSAYAAEKARLRAVDFADQERFALQLLSESDGRPSQVARWCHEQFEHVLVDEYQDINEVQDAILRLASRECLRGSRSSPPSNLFCVGDVKQSIYRFRLADPARFLRRAETLRQPNAAGRVIDLQANFRGRKPLLDAINSVFGRLMTRAAVDIEYDRSQELHAGLNYPPASGACFTGAPVELHLLPSRNRNEDADDGNDAESDELESPQREAMLIGRLIAGFMGRDGGPRMNIMVRDGDDGMRPRAIEYRDIVILLRSMRYQAEDFADTLRRCGIPVHNPSGVGYFQSIEVRDALALLDVLDNAAQDIPLAAVLRGPIARLASPEDALARIRAAYRSDAQPVPFHQAVVRYASEQSDELAASLRALLARLAAWRADAQRLSVADLLWSIYGQTGLLAWCQGLPNGAQRHANLLSLHQRALQFTSFSRQGLWRFLEFFRSLEKEVTVGVASELSQAEDVVRIMSIHAAKGLEFPVVFVPQLGKGINFQDTTGDIVADRQAHLGLSVVDTARLVRYPSLASTLVRQRLLQQTLAEEMRVLYVAMTRAREHLVLVGSAPVDAPDTWQQRWTGHAGALPAQDILKTRTMLGWIGPAWAAIDNPDVLRLHQHTADDIAAWTAQASAPSPPDANRQRLLDLIPLSPPPPPTPLLDRIVRRLTQPYAHARFTTLAASTSVTAFTKHGDADQAPLSPWERDGVRVDAPAAHAAQEGPSPSSPRSDPRPNEEPPLDLALPRPRFLVADAPLLPTERGVAVHAVLEHLDFSRTCQGEDLDRQIAAMLERRFITPAQANVVDRPAIAWLMQTNIGRLMRATAPLLIRELPFNYPLPADEFGVAASDDPLDRVMLRGRIDLLIPEGDVFHVLDYKTDEVRGPMLDQRIALYRGQVDIYRRAVQDITGRKVGRVCLAFLYARHIAEL